MSKINILLDLRTNVRAYHNADALPQDRLKDMSLHALLAYCHPSDREEYERRIKNWTKGSNEKWIENTNLTNQDLKCPDCGNDAMLRIRGCAPYDHIFYTRCDICRTERNVEYKNK